MNLPLPKRITRAMLFDLRNTTNFVYGDTLWRDGTPGGQASEARGAINAYPIMVKMRACANDLSSFLSDSLYEENCVMFKKQLALVPLDKPVIVFPKLGLGWNKMPEVCPRTYESMRALLRTMLGNAILNIEDV